MRVTEKTNYDAVRDSVHTVKSRMENLQNQAATLKKLNTPSDNPVGASKVLEVRTDKVNNEQFQSNGKLAESLLSQTDHVLEAMTETLQRAKEIALSQSSGASSNEATRRGVSEEVAQLFKHAVSLANTRIGDRYLFGGYQIHEPPVDVDGNYQGDDGHAQVEIAKGVFVASNVHGLEAFNTQPKQSADYRKLYGFDGGETTVSTRRPASVMPPPGAEEGQSAPGASAVEESTQQDFAPEKSQNANVFGELQNLRIALLTGDLDGIRNTLDRFDDLHSHVVGMRAKVGSRISGMSNTSQGLERQNLTNATLTQDLEDADMAQVVSDLAREETILRSALATSQKLMQPKLLDFLK